jgi:hypothetical protein
MRVLVTGHHGYLGTGDVLESAATYDHQVRQRLLVRPGITRLWQVSGWLRSVVGEVGLSYIENWLMIGDLVIAASNSSGGFFSGARRVLTRCARTRALIRPASQGMRQIGNRYRWAIRAEWGWMKPPSPRAN